MAIRYKGVERVDYLSLYGAALATALAAIQVHTLWRERKPRLHVSGEVTAVLQTLNEVDRFRTALDSGGPVSASHWAVVVQVVNVGPRDVDIARVRVTQRQGEVTRTFVHDAKDYPRALRRDGEARLIVRGDGEPVDLLSELQAEADVGLHKFRSRPFGGRKEVLIAVRAEVLAETRGLDLNGLRESANDLRVGDNEFWQIIDGPEGRRT